MNVATAAPELPFLFAVHGSLAASELAKAGGVSVRTAQRWIRRLAEGGELEVSARDPHRYVLRDTGQDNDAT